MNHTGLGTWQSAPGEHIDAAYVYGNEDEVGEGLAEGFKSAGIKREDVFVTTSESTIKIICEYDSRSS